MAKKFYWLKLKNNFFTDKRIKKLRKIAGGDTYTIIYLKLQLLSLENDGILIFEGVEPTFAEEMALEIDEDVDNVKITLSFLLQNGLIEETKDNEYMLVETVKNIGSESSSAERVRKFREKKTKALQCNTDVTKCNTEKEKENKSKEIELERELDNDCAEAPQTNKPSKSKKFVKPSVEEIQAYCLERNNNVDAERFFDYYESNGWKVGKNAMKDWKAAVRTWERGSNQTKEQSSKTSSGNGFLKLLESGALDE